MKWYKRLSNGLLAIIVVAIVAVIVFGVTAIIVPRTRKNYAADGFFVALFKDPPQNQDIYVDQDRTTGEITLKVNSKTDYELLEIKVTLVKQSDSGRYSNEDIITYVDENNVTREEQQVLTAKNVKKGSYTFEETFKPNKATLDNYKNYEIILEVVKYK